jgi:hypothetical protein
MRTVVLISVGFIAAVLLVLGCPSKPESPAPPQQPVPQAPKFAGLPIEMTVKQRTTTSVPGSGGAVSLSVDDITSGQVMASLAGKDGSVLLAPTSLVEGQSAQFKLGDKSYFLLLEALDNELVGDDSATFVFSDSLPAEEPLPHEPVGEDDRATDKNLEHEKVKRLIEHVGALEGAVFIRNGQEHTPAEAAEHLRRKWEAAAGEAATAEEFVDKAASKSSLSGEPYRIRTKDGVETEAGPYLKKRLGEMEAD